MKINKFFMIIILIPTVAQTNLWDDINRPRTPEDIKKRDIDLKYQEKKAFIQQKQADVTAQTHKKQHDLQYKQLQLEIQRKRDQLKANRP